MKKYKIIGLNVIIIILLLISIPNVSYAKDWNLKSMFGAAKNFIDTGVNEAPPISKDDVKKTSDMIYNVLLGIGTCVAFIWGIVLGIQFVTGSLEEKADVKKGVIIYIIGCIIIFGGFGIWKLVVNLLQPLA